MFDSSTHKFWARVYCTSTRIEKRINVNVKVLIRSEKHLHILQTSWNKNLLVFMSQNICKIYLDKLTKLQKWAIRTISKSHYRSHTRPLFAKYNILNVNDMYSLELGVFMYKYSINDLPNAFNDYFTKRSDIHGYKTRHVNDLTLTKNKKHFSDHSVRTTGPILWNSIDKKIINSKTVKQFRNQYKKTLISNYE